MNSVHIIIIITYNNNAIHFANTFQQFVIEYLQCLKMYSLFHRSLQHFLYVSFKTEQFFGVTDRIITTFWCLPGIDSHRPVFFHNTLSPTKCQYQGFVNFVRRLCWCSELENKNCEIGSMGTLKYARKSPSSGDLISLRVSFLLIYTCKVMSNCLQPGFWHLYNEEVPFLKIKCIWG